MFYAPFGGAVGQLGIAGQKSDAEIGRRITHRCRDYYSGSFLAQRMSVAIQRGNATSVMGTFVPGAIQVGLLQ